MKLAAYEQSPIIIIIHKQRTITRRWNLTYAISMTLMQTSGIMDAVNLVTTVEHMIKPTTALGVKLSCFLQKERERGWTNLEDAFHMKRE